MPQQAMKICCEDCPRISEPSIRKALLAAIRKIKQKGVAASWFDILRNGGFELTIRSLLLHEVQKQFKNALAFSEVYISNPSRKLDLVLYCRGCGNPIIVMEIKGNYFSQSTDIANEQENAKGILRVVSAKPKFASANLFIAHFIVKLGAEHPSLTACDHNHLIGTGYKRFSCGVGPDDRSEFLNGLKKKSVGLTEDNVIRMVTFRPRTVLRDSAFVQLTTLLVPFRRQRKKAK